MSARLLSGCFGAVACTCAAIAQSSFKIVAAGNTVQLSPFADDSIRVQIAPPGNSIQDPPLSALYLENPPVISTVAGPYNGVGYTNGNLAVAVDAGTGLITATRVSDNVVILSQTGIIFGAPTSPGTRPGSVSATISFSLGDERIYGLGEHRTGSVEMLGPGGAYFKRFQDSQDYSISTGADVSIPWYMSSAGYGFVWNSPGYGYVNMTRGGQVHWMANATMNVDFWITTTPAGNTTAQGGSVPPSAPSAWSSLLSHYIDAVGHAPTMPFYSTGFIQCKNRYRNASQLLDVAKGYITRGLPLSVIVLDYYHWSNMGDWSFNPACFPEPRGMVQELQSMGVQLKVTFWPFQTKQSQHWAQFQAPGLLATSLNGSLIPLEDSYYVYDSTNPASRKAVFDDFWQGYGQYGIQTVWLDGSEPERNANNFGKFQFLAGTDTEIGEAWIQQHVRTFADGFAARGIAPSDYYVLPRTAWAGSWRYSAGLWSGDIESTFSELELQIKVAQGVALSGIALWTSDIGGYKNGNASDPVFQELIVRWFQFGAFCPLFRLHGKREGGPPADECGTTNGDNEVWNLAADEAHYDGIVAAMLLRENLRQYVSDINAQTATTGMPMMRPMFLAYPDDPACQGPDVEDQYMFGPTWLVAPQYMYQATSRSVYLPALPPASEWVYWFNQTSVGQGGARVNVDTPIQEFPLFYIRSSGGSQTTGSQ